MYIDNYHSVSWLFTVIITLKVTVHWQGIYYINTSYIYNVKFKKSTTLPSWIALSKITMARQDHNGQARSQWPGWDHDSQRSRWPGRVCEVQVKFAKARDHDNQVRSQQCKDDNSQARTMGETMTTRWNHDGQAKFMKSEITKGPPFRGVNLLCRTVPEWPWNWVTQVVSAVGYQPCHFLFWEEKNGKITSESFSLCEPHLPNDILLKPVRYLWLSEQGWLLFHNHSFSVNTPCLLSGSGHPQQVNETFYNNFKQSSHRTP